MKPTGLKQSIRVWTAFLSAFFAVETTAQTTDVYFIGNSFTSTYDVPSVVRTLSAAGGHTVRTASDITGGSELADHWATGKAVNDISHTNYTFVVLQENSALSYTPSIQSGFNIYAPLFNQAITNSGAKTMLYMTWVRESTLYSLTNGIAIYRNMAKQLNCKMSPVGEAWRRIMLQYPSIDLFSADRHHPNEKGAYMSACNFYGAIFNQSPEGLSMRTVGGFILDANEAAIIQRIAWDAVRFVSYTNPPVINSMTVDQSVRTNNTPFSFQASASDNGSITNYLWNFGDGTVTNGPSLTTVAHNYTNDGIFLVTVKVTDNSGETERTGLTVTRDTTGPQISSIAAASQTLTVRFNQDIQQAGAETATNYAISGGVGASVVSATQIASNTVRLGVSPLTPGVQYTLTVNNLYSALGVKIYPDTYKTFMYVDSSGMHLLFDFGSTNYPTEGNWNNITYNGGDLVVSNAIDIYGVPRNIGLRCVPAAAITYSSGGGYGPIASNLYPATAQRDGIYATRKFSYQIEGTDPAGEYRLTFFASKSATNRETLFTVGASNAVLDCAYNSNRVAVIERVKPDADGNILFSVDTNTVPYCYISVLELEDTRGGISRLIETDVSSMDIAEGTVSNIMVRLSSQPASNLTVSVNASGYAHVQVLSESAFLYFATTNWNVWQPVYVEAINDGDADNGTATIQIADVGDVYSSTSVSATQIDKDGIGFAGFTASPVSGRAPLTVSFTDASTIGGITNWYWDFGDGTTTNTTATNITHTYTTEGTNTVQLTVSGPLGSDTNTQTGLIIVSAAVPAGSPVHLDLSGAYDYDAFVTGEEITYATGQGNEVKAVIGDHAVKFYTVSARTGIAHLADPAGAHPGVAENGMVDSNCFELAKGLTTKFGTASGSTKVNNAVAVLPDGISTAFSRTITLAAGDQQKYSDLNLLVNGDRKLSASSSSATLSVKYTGDSNWYTVWTETAAANTAGGCFGGTLDGGATYSNQSTNWTQIAVATDGTVKVSGGLTVASSGSSYMYKFATPVPLDSSKVLESFRMETTTSSKSYVNDFFLYAATATAVVSGPASADADGDGLPDEWEQQYYDSASATPDTLAANGHNTIREMYIAGLNPTNPAARFGLSVQQSVSQRILGWNAVSGRVYSVYWTTNLLSGFQPLETNIAWPQNSWTDTVHNIQGDGYYRIGVQLCP